MAESISFPATDNLDANQTSLLKMEEENLEKLSASDVGQEAGKRDLLRGKLQTARAEFTRLVTSLQPVPTTLSQAISDISAAFSALDTKKLAEFDRQKTQIDRSMASIWAGYGAIGDSPNPYAANYARVEELSAPISAPPAVLTAAPERERPAEMVVPIASFVQFDKLTGRQHADTEPVRYSHDVAPGSPRLTDYFRMSSGRIIAEEGEDRSEGKDVVLQEPDLVTHKPRLVIVRHQKDDEGGRAYGKALIASIDREELNKVDPDRVFTGWLYASGKFPKMNSAQRIETVEPDQITINQDLLAQRDQLIEQAMQKIGVENYFILLKKILLSGSVKIYTDQDSTSPGLVLALLYGLPKGFRSAISVAAYHGVLIIKDSQGTGDWDIAHLENKGALSPNVQPWGPPNERRNQVIGLSGPYLTKLREAYADGNLDQLIKYANSR